MFSTTDKDSFEAFAKDLQHNLALVDCIESKVSSGLIHFQVLKLPQLKLKMYQETHKTPHLHIDYGRNDNHVASFQIDPPKRIEGKVRKSIHEKVIVLILEKNREGLLQIWSELQQGNEKKAREICIELSASI